MINIQEEKIAIIIPMYRVESQISKVIQQIPEWVDLIIAVDDKSPDQSSEIVESINDPRIILIKHKKNQGVGGAMISGFKKALEYEASIIVKVDGDNQMPLDYLPQLISPILEGEADYSKGNRFSHAKEILNMPFIRRFGNIVLSFMAKLASGYWNIFDPTNGFFAITGRALSYLDLTRVSKTYFFENSMLVELGIINAKIVDVSIPAVYNNEVSSLSIAQVLLEFPRKLLKSLLRRLWLTYFVLDFNVGSLFLLLGTPLMLFGLVYGANAWIKYSNLGLLTPTGTIMLATLSIILGFQLLLQMVVFDVTNFPKQSISKRDFQKE